MSLAPKIGDKRTVNGVREVFGVFGEWEPQGVAMQVIEYICKGSDLDTHCGKDWLSAAAAPAHEVAQLYVAHGYPVEAQCPACLRLDERASNCPGGLICKDPTCPAEHNSETDRRMS